MKISKPFIAVGIFIFICILTVNSFAQKNDLKILHEKTLQTSSDKTLKIDATVGDIKVTSWDKNEVYVKIMGNKKAEEKVEFSFNSDDEDILISAKRETGFWGWFSGNIRIRFEIFVPSKYNLRLKTSGGDMSLSNIDGKIKLMTSGGDLRIIESVGPMEISTSGGDIVLNNCVGKFQLKTSGGDISAKNIKGNILASTSGGDINLVASDSQIEASTSGGDVRVDYSGENLGISLSTSGGDIVVIVPENFGARAELSTLGGDIKCNLPTNNVIKITSSKFEADLNEGGKTIKCKTSGGDIKVSKK